MHRVLSDPAILLAGQDEQGAPALREALSGYMYETRGVHAAADNIIIGNGVTPLLRILGYILRNKHSRIAVEEPGFRLGREVSVPAAMKLFRFRYGMTDSMWTHWHRRIRGWFM